MRRRLGPSSPEETGIGAGAGAGAGGLKDAGNEDRPQQGQKPVPRAVRVRLLLGDGFAVTPDLFSVVLKSDPATEHPLSFDQFDMLGDALTESLLQHGLVPAGLATSPAGPFGPADYMAPGVDIVMRADPTRDLAVHIDPAYLLATFPPYQLTGATPLKPTSQLLPPAGWTPSAQHPAEFVLTLARSGGLLRHRAFDDIDRFVCRVPLPVMLATSVDGGLFVDYAEWVEHWRREQAAHRGGRA